MESEINDIDAYLGKDGYIKADVSCLAEITD